KPAARILAIPVCQRYINDDNKPVLFNHPNIVYLPSHVTGQTLYSTISTVIPPDTVYSVVLTDGQGKHCSRCQHMDHCTGCVMSREGEITLQPGDHLAVQVEDVTRGQITQAECLVDHVTMNDLRPDEPVTIYDCFTAFTQCEVLDEQNPWFCPQCRKNQCANKRMTVWRYPDTLIVHLKRFVFHEFSSTKIDNPVIFPQKNLQLTDFLSGPKNNDLQYDLYSIVCHFGGSNSGHYTSYTRHPINGEWFYYNDETVTQSVPKDEEYSSGYVLFYQKLGSNVRITPGVKYSNCDNLLPSVCCIDDDTQHDIDPTQLDFYS
ncbi:ubiquitin carboxyl-terminal hydrolase 32, partial [Patella vulgata]|uniref:ubiquitin carboxyl-terminal hydrolase 32 n=1 Tax=Patella vulgata TaxID=6465 RepID=UPI00217F28CD